MKATPSTATGIKVDISILCETEDEILTHLSVIRKRLKDKLKTINNEITETIELKDENCYGEHIVIINLDK